jgi:HAD superfamily hydrolase (TIGR01509 family)
MNEFSNVTHLLFDHDGVLVDTEFWYYKATQDELRAMDITMTLEDYMDHMVTGQSAYASALSAPEREAFRERRNRRYENFLLTQDIQIPGVENTLAALHGKYPMAIVTTSRREHFDLIHEHRHIVPYFDFVLALGDYKRAKPAPDPYQAALDRFGITAAEALVIEDSARGLGSAVAAGIRCITVYNEFTAAQDFSAAAEQIESLTQLPELLGGRMPGLQAD